MEGETRTKTNTATIAGFIEDEAVFSHSVYGEGFYTFHVSVPRLSEAKDLVPVTVSERLCDPALLVPGERVEILGQFRSYNNYSDEGNRLMLTLFARELRFPEGESEVPPNEIVLVGFICKPPVYRHTPFGREIADMLIAVNRSYNKSDYIPCIAWGRNARFSRTLAVGDKVRLSGRIQSREYRKRLSEEEYTTKTAYEISVIKIETAAEA